MNFISFDFLIFLGIVLFIYNFLNYKWQNILLLIGSYVFYGWWDYRFLSLLLFSSLVDFACASKIQYLLDSQSDTAKRKILLTLSIISNLGVLFTFKYFNFFVDSTNSLFESVGLPPTGWAGEVILPIGISFYTFQSMSYTIDVYKGEFRATRKLINFLLYVSFFPQLVAGPIERAGTLLKQVTEERRISIEKFTSGLLLMEVGFFKKMVIADHLAIIVDRAYFSGPSGLLTLLLGLYAFAFQIYCDFSGYSDIARGVARMMGFELRVNFNLPYFSANPGEFWRRWHISLSTWLRDYLFIPLGGSRGGSAKTARNLIWVMLLGGLWHGAAWHYILWGMYHGLLLAIYSMLPASVARDRKSASRLRIGQIIIFFHLTCIGWLLFAFDIGKIRDVLNAALDLGWGANLLMLDVWMMLILVIPLVLLQMWGYRRGETEPWLQWSLWPRIGMLLGLFYGSLLLGAAGETPFIYFQF